MKSVPILPQNFACGSHRPVASGVALEPETGDPQATLLNLNRLIHSSQKRKVVNILKSDGDVAVVFATGEVYFAIGFAGTEELAEFASQNFHGSLDMWMQAAEKFHDGEMWPVPGARDPL